MSTYYPPNIQTLRDLPQTTDNPALIVISPIPDSNQTTTSSPTPTAQTITHNDLRQRIATYMQTLQTAVAASSTITIVMPNTTECIISFLAVTSAGYLAAPLNPAYTADEFAFYLTDSESAAVIIPSTLSSRSPIHTACQRCNIPIFAFPSHLVSPTFTPTDESQDYPGQPPKSSTRALFLHTSGTTSRPKGVPLTHENLTTSIRNICKTYELTTTDRTVLVMPLFHVHGLMAATLSTLATGGCIIIPPGGKFSARAFWPSAVIGKATWFTAVPTMHQILLARAALDYDAARAPKLRFIRSCSASLAPAVLQRVEDTFEAPVLEAYAMTEASHQMTSNPLPKYGIRKPGSVGVAQGVEVAVLDEGNDAVAVGTVGEVCIRGRNVTAGYYKNESANLEAFAGGWFHTGDQGSLDGEGYLTLTGRIKELVNRGGEKISPLEVDAALLAHDDVKEAVSFAAPDEKYGEEVNAAVILRDGASVSVEELMAFVGGRLAAFKVPKRIFVSEDLPRTATGKIQRRIVAKHFLDDKRDGKTSGEK